MMDTTVKIRHLFDDEGWRTRILIRNTVNHVDTTRNHFQVVDLGKQLLLAFLILVEDIGFHVLSDAGVCGFTPPTLLVSDEVVSTTRLARLFLALGRPLRQRFITNPTVVVVVQIHEGVRMPSHIFGDINPQPVEVEEARCVIQGDINDLPDLVPWINMHLCDILTH